MKLKPKAPVSAYNVTYKCTVCIQKTFVKLIRIQKLTKHKFIFYIISYSGHYGYDLIIEIVPVLQTGCVLSTIFQSSRSCFDI